MKNGRRIIVIGSGIAGLACARELIQRGYEVLVVEARDRVGGRLKGIPLELGKEYPVINPTKKNADAVSTSQTVDLGGALIHGIDKNPVHAVTTQMGVPVHAISDHCLLLDENGWPFDPKEDDKISTLFNECLDETFRQVADDKQCTGSFGELFDKVCEKKGISPTNALMKWHKANLELPSGADFRQLGYTWNDDEPYGFAGKHAAVETSWKFVMEKMADGLDILHGSPVTRIQIVLPDGTTPGQFESDQQPSSTSEKLPVVKSEQVEEAEEVEVEEEEKKEEPRRSDVSDSKLPAKTKVPTPKPRRSQRTRVPPPVTKVEKDTTPRQQPKKRRLEVREVRRSSRSNKGVIRLLSIEDSTSLCYDDPTKKHHRKKRTEPKEEEEEGESSNVEDSEPIPSSTVQITLQNGSVLEANAVVCTAPLGVLKIPQGKPGHISFVPPLSPAKQQAIEELGCGLLNKCAMAFPDIFWQDSDFLGLAGSTHCYLVLNAAKFTQRPILIFMYGGSFAKDLEAWTDSEIVADCLYVLKKICGKDVPPPTDYCVTRWGKEQFSRMAFTYIPPGVDGPKQLAAASEAIYDPVLPDKPLIMFAGEHTTPYHPSTMHGAFLSGIREAYRLDLYFEPALNDYMKFELHEKLYMHTFPTKRAMKASKKAQTNSASATDPTSTAAAATNSGNQIRSRRYRFGSMCLRKQPKKVVDPNTQAKKDTAASTTTSSTTTSVDTAAAAAAGASSVASLSRRSKRSLSTKKVANSDKSNALSEIEAAQEKKRLIDELEDRILLRSLESFGRDCALMRSSILPVFGSTRRRNADQIRTRWHHLLPRKQKRPSDKIDDDWTAKTIAMIPPVGTDANSNNGDVNRRTSSSDGGTTGDENVRRSKREVKPRVLLDV